MASSVGVVGTMLGSNGAVLTVRRRVDEVGPSAIERTTIILDFSGPSAVELEQSDAGRLCDLLRSAARRSR